MEVGERVGRYRLLEPLGRGGMGIVWKAVAADMAAAEPVVLKSVAAPWLPAAQAVKQRRRLQREAKILGGLRHSGVVGAIETFAAAGELYLVLEYVPGPTLKDWLRRLPPPPLGERLAVMRQIGAALVYTHARGVIHRDLKPANVIVAAGEQAKVLDFGLARNLDSTRLTQTGYILGTLRYMAPEVARTESVDERADIYALGILVGGILGLRGPFRPMPQRDFHRWLASPAPVEIDPWLPADVRERLLRLVAKDPAGRADADAAVAFIDDLIAEGDALDARLKTAREQRAAVLLSDG